ncbi:hypothetical protein Pint_23498 [Pistacia integerrima]|uniref:Uncharacterized protein n=1 Tax=Pistacia integerrima TaxID=434235 RepID=A0ACC0YKP0_9ROSI|nr:hypothetical protein Pint_23498 [Pistacia integerrima]
MDLWVVAAATGAGYIAKYWRNLKSNDRETSSASFSLDSIYRQSESRNLLQQIRDQTSPLRRLAGEQLDIDGLFIHGKDFIGFTTTQRQVENNDDYNLLSLTSFPPLLKENENFQGNGNGMEGKSNFSDVSRHLRSRYYGNFLEPLELDSLENSLRAQLLMEYAAMEEYVHSSVPEQSIPTVRPLLLTDGSRIISRASCDSNREMQLQNGEYKLQSEDGLEQNEMQLLQRKLKQEIRRRSRRFSVMRDGTQTFHSEGLPNPKLLFFLGISIGVMSTILANKGEMENLNEQLQENENLVQDLQEELEMKELLNVKELKLDEAFESSATNKDPLLSDTPHGSYTKQELDIYNNSDGEEPDDQKAVGSEAMSKIEAELEAELERLEINMRTYSLEKIPDYVELDPGFDTDIVHGDLKLDKAKGDPGGLSDSDHEVSGTSTNPPDIENYAVSPRELSLQLHKVIQSRLEARIMELEAALEHNQKRLHSMKSESVKPWRERDSYGELESSSHESTTFIDENYEDD